MCLGVAKSRIILNTLVSSVQKSSIVVQLNVPVTVVQLIVSFLPVNTKALHILLGNYYFQIIVATLFEYLEEPESETNTDRKFIVSVGQSNNDHDKTVDQIAENIEENKTNDNYIYNKNSKQRQDKLIMNGAISNQQLPKWYSRNQTNDEQETEQIKIDPDEMKRLRQLFKQKMMQSIPK